MPTPEKKPSLKQQQFDQMVLQQRMEIQAHLAVTKYQPRTQKVDGSKNLLQRLTPHAAGRFIRNLGTKQKETSPTESEPSSAAEESTSDSSSSSTLRSKHLGPSSDDSSSITITEKAAEPPTEQSLKRKRPDDDEELDEVADRVKRLKVERKEQKALWDGFDDSQFKMNSGLLYDSKLWEWYW